MTIRCFHVSRKRLNDTHLLHTQDSRAILSPLKSQSVSVIACKPAFPPYLAALNPTDQVFDFEELEYHYLVANRTEDAPSKDDDDDDDDDEGKPDSKEDKCNGDENETSPGGSTGNAVTRSPIIDNPYLKAAVGAKQGKSEVSVSLNFNWNTK